MLHKYTILFTTLSYSKQNCEQQNLLQRSSHATNLRALRLKSTGAEELRSDSKHQPWSPVFGSRFKHWPFRPPNQIWSKSTKQYSYGIVVWIIVLPYPAGTRDFSRLQGFQTVVSGSHPASYLVVTWGSDLEVKRPEYEANHSPHLMPILRIWKQYLRSANCLLYMYKDCITLSCNLCMPRSWDAGGWPWKVSLADCDRKRLWLSIYCRHVRLKTVK